MHGMSPDMDVSFLEGQRLIQACFGKHDLILNFDETASISLLITSSIGSAVAGEELQRDSDFTEHASTLLHCLDVLTTSVFVVDSQTLRIGFANGTTLEVYDDSKQFESLVITHAGRTIVV
jgi:hypothetical protein